MTHLATPGGCARRPPGLLALELGDAPVPDASVPLEAPCDEPADLRTRLAFHSEQFDGLQFGAD